MTFPRYPEYKDSGVEWLGEVPRHWITARLGFECETIVPMRDKPEHLDGEIPWIRIEDFNGKFIGNSKSGQGVSESTVAAMNLKVLPAGTVLCSCSCSMGATAIVTRPLITNQTFIGIVPKQSFISDYLYYFFHMASDHLNSIGTGAIQTYLSRDDFRRLRMPRPSVHEQTQIAAFLDRETAKIDALVAEQRRLMALLKEKRQAVISHAVTRGLNPDAPMKPSGVEWLGDVPAHWEVNRYKNALSLFQGMAFKSSDYVDYSVTINVRMGNIRKGGFINLEHNVKYLPDEFAENYAEYALRENDLIIAMTDMSPSLEFLAVPAILKDLDPECVYLLNQRVGKLTVKRALCRLVWNLTSQAAMH
jgi:type I restriction enzyme S subunit